LIFAYLTTHVFKLEKVPSAYDMITERSEPFIGILIEYDANKALDLSDTKVPLQGTGSGSKPSALGIGFIGAGSYAQSYLLPNIPKTEDILMKGVMTVSSTSSRSVADRFGFEFCTSNTDDILNHPEINTIFIASHHDSHGKYVISALKAGKNVFVEKPLCLTTDEFQEIRDIVRSGSPLLMIGFNRRFSPLTAIIREKIGTGPMSMTYRVNAGKIVADSWIQDIKTGGGRIIGEVCHFIDYLTCINGSLPISVYAVAMSDPENLNDTLAVLLRYENGSIGTVSYFSNGSKSVSKEYVEIYCHRTTAILKDFRELKIYGAGKPYKKSLLSQDKGQKNEVRLFLKAVKEDAASLIPLKEMMNASEIPFKIIESVQTGKVIP